MGFIFYATDPNMDDDTEEEMKEMIASSKGWGTSLDVCEHTGRQARWHQAHSGGDIATKDEFAAIKGSPPKMC